jgi:translation initiation factor 2 subunit 3
MSKELDAINLGMFGHIDHGKTTLLEKLSGKWTDTHSEEIKRGITIKLGYADAIICYDSKEGYNIKNKGEQKRHVSFIDAPGHEMLMATTLSGAALIDAAILVVAANEGIKPQTREHLMVLQAKGIKNIIVVQNKIDLVDEQAAKKNHAEIKKFLGEHHKNVEIIPVSAQQGVNVSEVLRAIVELPIPKRDLDSEPVFIVARSFDINRPGTSPKELHGAVLGGTLKRGKFKVGDEIEIKPGRAVKDASGKKYFPLKTKIRTLFKGSGKVDELTPGGSMSIETSLDMALGKADSLSGNLVSLAGKLPNPEMNIKLAYSLFPKAFGSGQIDVAEIKQGETLMLSVNTSVTGGIVKTISKGNIEISLKVPAILFKGDSVGIARNVQGHWRLIGCGTVC